jgi:hypothetical protein
MPVIQQQADIRQLIIIMGKTMSCMKQNSQRQNLGVKENQVFKLNSGLHT